MKLDRKQPRFEAYENAWFPCPARWRRHLVMLSSRPRPPHSATRLSSTIANVAAIPATSVADNRSSKDRTPVTQ